MISWIQHHLIRHGRWIFLTLLAVIILAFVFTIGNTPGCTTDRSNYQQNLFYGIDLNAPRERDPLVEKVSLSAYLNNQQIRTDQQFQGQLTSRIAMLHLADEVGIPSPTQERLAEYIKTKNVFRGPDGEFSPDAYTRFVDQFESNPRASKGMVINILEEDFRIEQVSAALAGPGYLLPSEASVHAQRSRTTLSLATAVMTYASFEPEIEPDVATLKAYYEANKQRYEIPERVEASYVLFESDRFADQISAASEAELREHFAANRAEFVAEYEAARPKPVKADEAEEAEEAAEPEAVTFDKVREAVARSYTKQRAAEVAHEAATAFAYQLYRDDIALDSAPFNQLLNQAGVSLTEIVPYTEAGARQRALSPEMLESAFALTGKRYYSDAYELDNGYAVLIYKSRIDPVIPPYEEVASEVSADYKTEEKRRLFNEKGESLKAELEAAVADGTAFSEAAESLGLKVNTYDSFEVKDAPAQLNRSALQQAQSLSAGEITPMLTLSGTGTFVYVESKEVPELSEEDPDLAQTRSMLERWASFTTRSELTNELVLRGLPGERAEPVE
jgi:peptidyl-prolyl cis-trans isomerase D